MPRLAQATRLERRQQLIDAAWRCLADRGFASITVDDVCEEAGVSKGAFYVYFEQKQDLLVALLDDETAEMNALMAELQGARIDAVTRLRRFSKAMIDRSDEPARLQLLADLWAEMPANPLLREKWIDVVRAQRETLRTWIEDGISVGGLAPLPANAFAAILLALGEGLLLHAGLDPTGFRWTNVEKALDVILGRVGGS
jgi:TetR/AcrR family transcriptional repressor of uid operon